MQQKPTLNASDLLANQDFTDLLGQLDEFKAPAAYNPPRGKNPKGGPGRLRRKPPESYPDHPAYVAPEKRPRGRPQGAVENRKEATKSSVMQQRIALEAGLREYIAHPERRKMLQEALDRILRVAAHGLEDKDSVAAARVLFDKLMGSVKQEEDTTQSGAPQIQIVIENATLKPPQPAIEAEFSEVKE